MKIQEIRKCGDGIEVVVGDVAYFFNLNDFSTPDDLMALVKTRIASPQVSGAADARIVTLKTQLENQTIK